MPEQRFVVYRGIRMVEGWPERIQAAQSHRELMIQGVPFARIPYGSETEDWEAATRPCHDCQTS